MLTSYNHRFRVTAVLATAAALAAGALVPAQAASSSVKISFIGVEQPSTQEPMIAAFQAKNPKIKVSYKQIPFEQYNNTVAQRIGTKSTTIDVLMVDQPNVSQYAAKGYLSDLSALKAKASKVLSPAMYSVNLYKNKLWSLSINDSTQMLFYNKEMLDKAGITYPSQDPKKRITWEDITANSKKVVDSGAGQYGYFIEQVESVYNLQALTESAGGGSGITGKDMLTPNIQNAGWLKAMKFYQDSFKNGYQPKGVGGWDTGPMFSDGKVAYFIGGPWDISAFSAAKFNWGIAAHPYFAGGKAVTPTGSWSLGVNSASKLQAAAKAFVEFASLNTEGNLILCNGTGSIPANKLALPKYLGTLDGVAGDKSKGVSALIAYEVGKTAVPRASSVGFVQFDDIMSKAFADIRNGSDITTRLSQAAKSLNDAWSLLK